VYLIVGSTPGVELPALVKVLNDMGGQALPPDATPRWQALLADFNDTASAMKELEKALEPAQKPTLLPVTFDIGLESLEQVMANLDDVALLLFYSRPEPFLVRAMSAETSASMALESWCTASRSMLEAIHRYRSRAVLFNAESALTSAAAFKEVCRERFRLEGRSEDKASVAAQEPMADIHRLIAAQMVVQSVDVQDLLDELEASAVPSDTLSVMPHVNCDDALAEWRGQGESDQLKEENELLLLQLHQVQEELESYYLQLQEAESKLREADKKYGETKKKLGQTEKKLEASETNRGETAKKLRETGDKHKAARAWEEQLKREVAEAQDTLARLRQSRSWRITKPLRGIRTFLRSWPGRRGAT
jgi:hypothetical protein